MSRWTECQDVEEELSEKKKFLGKTLALWERVTFSVSVFISMYGWSVSGVHRASAAGSRWKEREREKKGPNCSKLRLRASRKKSSRIVTGGVSGANPMTGFKVGMVVQVWGLGDNNNNTHSQSKVPLSNKLHLHLLPRRLSRPAFARSLARSGSQQFPIFLYPDKDSVGEGNLERHRTIFSGEVSVVARHRGSAKPSPQRVKGEEATNRILVGSALVDFASSGKSLRNCPPCTPGAFSIKGGLRFLHLVFMTSDSS